MSRDRARRRAEREALESARREAEARRRARREPWRRLGAAVRPPSRTRRRRLDSPLRRARHRQDAALVAVLAAVHIALWLWTDSWLWRASALLLTVMAWPVLVTVLFDRRSRT